MSTIEVRHGDCLDVLQGMDACSVDALVTDPPAGIAFMGKSWDANRGGRDQWVKWLRERMEQCHRVLKPGAHAVVWALPRTSHWTAWAVEDAGFEIRDVAVHLFGQGMPKSKHVLKPAAEHWILARKPLVGSVKRNITEHGTGGLNIDACRIPTSAADATAMERANTPGSGRMKAGGSPIGTFVRSNPTGAMDTTAGRWPANVTLDDESAELLDDRAGTRKSGRWPERRGSDKFRQVYGGFTGQPESQPLRESNTGGPSRFFYVAKVRGAERGDNTHPTVKPVDLVQWLIRLVTPPDGLVLDCFAGSGTTGVAAQLENRRAILIESEAEYVNIIRRRLAEPIQPGLGL